MSADLTVAGDLRRPTGRFPKFWARCFGSEHAGYWLRRDLLDHMRAGVAAFRPEYVRFHGILSEPVGLVRSWRGGTPELQWFNFERVYDHVRELGLRPIVEWSFMPAALARGRRTIFYWRGNIEMPRRLKDWGELIEAATRRLVRRYGLAEVRRWYFEVWNEPNLPKWFFAGTMRDYFALYDHAVEAVRRVDARLSVGGPATACAEWVGELLEHCRTENFARPGRRGTPLDFVSYHLYPTDPFFMEREGMPFGWKGEAFFRESIRRNLALVRRSAFPQAEIHMTEWNVSSNTRDRIHDTPAAAAFACKAVQEVAGCVDTFSWWTLSDVFEEGGLPPAAFHGGFGLCTVDGLRKPAWHAFAALQELGEELLAPPATTADHGAGVIPTRGADGSARVLAWAFRFPGTRQPKTRTIRVTVGGWPAGRSSVAVQVRRIDATHSNVTAAWRNLGAPGSLLPAQLARLRQRDGFEDPAPRAVPVRNGAANVSFRLPSDAVALLELR